MVYFGSFLPHFTHLFGGSERFEIERPSTQQKLLLCVFQKHPAENESVLCGMSLYNLKHFFYAFIEVRRVSVQNCFSFAEKQQEMIRNQAWRDKYKNERK